MESNCFQIMLLWAVALLLYGAPMSFASVIRLDPATKAASLASDGGTSQAARTRFARFSFNDFKHWIKDTGKKTEDVAKKAGNKIGETATKAKEETEKKFGHKHDEKKHEEKKHEEQKHEEHKDEGREHHHHEEQNKKEQ